MSFSLVDITLLPSVVLNMLAVDDGKGGGDGWKVWKI